MSAAERPISTPDTEIPEDELAPDVENLIAAFRGELTKLPEFQKKLSEIYFSPYGSSNMEGIDFHLGENFYLINYHSGLRKQDSPFERQPERLDIIVNSANIDTPKRAMLGLRRRGEKTFGQAEYAAADTDGNMNWEEHHNKKSALEGARGILKEIRDYKR